MFPSQPDEIISPATAPCREVLVARPQPKKVMWVQCLVDQMAVLALRSLAFKTGYTNTEIFTSRLLKIKYMKVSEEHQHTKTIMYNTTYLCTSWLCMQKPIIYKLYSQHQSVIEYLHISISIHTFTQAGSFCCFLSYTCTSLCDFYILN